VVVGGDGFGFAKRADGTQCKIVQSGVTILEDDVRYAGGCRSYETPSNFRCAGVRSRALALPFGAYDAP
jgi:hypothetical protein